MAAPVFVRSRTNNAASKPTHRGQCQPVNHRPSDFDLIGIQRDQRGTGFSLDQAVKVDQHMGQCGNDPHADGEFAAFEPQHEKGKSVGKDGDEGGTDKYGNEWVEPGICQPHSGIGTQAKKTLVVQPTLDHHNRPSAFHMAARMT